MDMPTDHSSPDGPLSPIHHIHSPSPGTQLRAELSAQRHMAALEIPDSQEYSHSKPITPGDVFDNDSLSDVSATGSDAPGTPSPARPSSRDLMPPPPPPNVASRQRSRSPQVSTLVHPAFRGEENLPSRPGSSEPVQGPKGSSRLSPITIGSPEPSGDSCPPRQADVVVAQYPVDDEVPAYESQDGLDEPLAPFDWKDLEQRYHDMINDKEKEFDSVWEEYCQLQDFFSIWCGMMGKRETDRTFKRHKTQQFYVREEEKSLDHLREHYDKVMTAFNTAMAMLGPQRGP